MTTEQKKIEEWVKDYSDSMYHWTVSRINDSSIAEDLVQETFLSAINSLSKFKEESNPKTWLFSILKNKISDHYRKHFKMHLISESNFFAENGSDFWDRYFTKDDEWKPREVNKSWEVDDLELLDDIEFRYTLEECLKLLNPKSFLAIQYKYLEEKEGKIICKELGITPSNFWQLLHRAKLQLRDCLDVNWFNK
jgi:RNA polymerase sigma-70 factor (ECF subfamily)